MRNPNDCVHRWRASAGRAGRAGAFRLGLLVVVAWCVGAWRGVPDPVPVPRCGVRMVPGGWVNDGRLDVKGADFTYQAAYMGT